MISDASFLLTLIATALTGILAGASLDQSIKQLPARHRTGALAYSVYSRASDLGNGLIWYAAIGMGAALLTLLAAIVAFFHGVGMLGDLPLYIAAVLSVLHSLVTTQAAPLMHRQRNQEQDEATLASLFDRFARWQALRASLQVLAFAMLLWAMLIRAG